MIKYFVNIVILVSEYTYFYISSYKYLMSY